MKPCNDCVRDFQRVSRSCLLKAAFSLFCASQSGRTPLHLAANNGSLEVVRHLCLAGANIDAVTNVRHLSVLPLGRV